MDIYLVISIGYIHLLALSMGAKDIVNGNNNRAIGSAGKAAAMAAKFVAVDKEGVIHNPFLDEKPTDLFNETRGFINPSGNYSIEIPPEDAEVEVDIKISSISEVDTDAETVSMSLMLQLSWRDPRLDWPKGGPPEGTAFNLPTDLQR